MADKRSFKVITLGCKVNQYESAYFNDALSGMGLRQAGVDEPGDVIIINTCVVTGKAAHQSRQLIRKAIRENPGAFIAAVGCYAQTAPDEMADIDGVGLIADNRMKTQVPAFLANALKRSEKALLLREHEPGAPFDSLDIRSFPGRTRAYVKIQDGCESFCSYCIVPLARGPCRSLAPGKVLHSLETLSGQGYREVVLTGIHLGMYGVDLKGRTNLASLLRMVGGEGFPLRIRLSSIEPKEISPELVDMVASEDWLCRHFHIPLQSGDDRILGKMNRKYTTRDYASIVRSIFNAIPHVCIGVDIMAGFPGEDEAAHRNSCSLLEDLPVSYLHVFPFSPRPGTAAERMRGRVEHETIKERARELRAIGDIKRDRFYKSCLHQEFEVLAEGRDAEVPGLMEGRSDNYLPVCYPNPRGREGEFVRVVVESSEGTRLRGSLIFQPRPLSPQPYSSAVPSCP